MLTSFQAIILGLVQGATELFPVSSLGHSVILPALFRWNINQSADSFLIFLVVTHLATSLVLVGFFFKDWVCIVRGIGRSLRQREIKSDDVYARLGWRIIVATIPVGILGLLFQDKLQALFAEPIYVAGFLVANGALLLAIEWGKRHYHLAKKVEDDLLTSSATTALDSQIATLSWSQSVKIGGAQCLALIPGFSRTGVTLGGGLATDLDHEAAARFSFLLATPIIFAAAVLKLPDLLSQNASAGSMGAPVIGNIAFMIPLMIGFITAALAAYLSVRFLTRYFKTKSLMPFGVYCIVIGLASLFLLL